MNAATPRTNRRARVRVEELKLHGHRYRDRIGGDGPPIVLIHGINGSSETWGDVLPLLARDYQVLAPDLLGHGDSAKPRGDYSLCAYASGIRDPAVPTLFVWGERDRVIPAQHGRNAQREVPGSRLELLPGAGHFPYRDEPVRFVEALGDFMEDTEPAQLRAADLRDRLLRRAEN